MFLIGKFKPKKKPLPHLKGICVSSSFGLCAFGLPKKSMCLPLCPQKPVLENYECITKPPATSTEIDFSEIQHQNYEINSSQGSPYADYGASNSTKILEQPIS